ncbi:MAG TPA: hypothetical protein VMU87_12385 [Stellaceae bacterium]|nr:hypothetical protein [Stellaceae bacterium]
MDEKPVAGIVTAAAVVPLVLLCCLGPVVVGSVIGGVAGWLGGLGPAEIAGAAVALAAITYGLLRWRRRQLRRGGPQNECGPFGTACTFDGAPETTAPKPSHASPERNPEPIHPVAERAQ